MAFEAYLQYFSHGVPHGIPRSKLVEAFTSWAIEQETPDAWNLRSGPDHCHLLISNLPGQALAHSVTFGRPPLSGDFWDRVFALMDDTAVVYCPGGALIVRSADAVTNIPPEMLSALGVPAVASDARTLRQQLLV